MADIKVLQNFLLLICMKPCCIFIISQKIKYIDPVNLIIQQLCSKGIYDHVEGGIARYCVDEKWIVPHFEKMLYDNTQFILLLSKYCKINSDNYFKYKLEQTIEFLKKNFLNSDGFLGSAYDADSEGKKEILCL